MKRVPKNTPETFGVELAASMLGVCRSTIQKTCKRLSIGIRMNTGKTEQRSILILNRSDLLMLADRLRYKVGRPVTKGKAKNGTERKSRKSDIAAKPHHQNRDGVAKRRRNRAAATS